MSRNFWWDEKRNESRSLCVWETFDPRIPRGGFPCSRRVLLQGTLITDLIISFMYEQRPFHSRIRVNKPNFRLNPFNGGAAYLLTGRWTCVRGSLSLPLFLSLLPSSCFVISSRNRKQQRGVVAERSDFFPREWRPSRMFAKLPADPYLSLSLSPRFPPLPFIPPRFPSFPPGRNACDPVVVGLIKAWTASF